MPTSYELFGFILLVIETLIGMVGNGFIAIVNFIDWHRSRKLSPADMILSFLGLFRFLFHEVVIHSAIFNLFLKDAVQLTDVKMAGYSSWTFVTTTDLWFATWLSVLYCVKIANFSHPVFLQMKRRFPGLVPWLLLGTVVFSAITTTVAVIGSSKMTKCNLFESFPSNNSDSGIKMSNDCWYVALLYTAPNFLPFMIFLSSSILLLTSLWRHKNHLQSSARDASTEVHLNAIKALASFLILYISSFLMEILSILNYWVGITDAWVHILILNVLASYSSGHAVILIFMNPRLKQKSIRILHQLKC
ncbi:taste receptor type 2 member 8-like [Podarcis raffonei]|uniref:taste receptor type 2 member 8-like n=1 Tax=Podarcis raffonei TaxID=65483 RepID=UPI0023290A35|nr:taste receptor type 2 member 8-like [Podarcis raffonei]